MVPEEVVVEPLTAGERAPPSHFRCSGKLRCLGYNGEYYFLGFSQRSGRWRIPPPTSAAFTDLIKCQIFLIFLSEIIHHELVPENPATAAFPPVRKCWNKNSSRQPRAH